MRSYIYRPTGSCGSPDLRSIPYIYPLYVRYKVRYETLCRHHHDVIMTSSPLGPQLVFIREEDVFELPDFQNRDEVLGSRNQDYVIDSITEINEGK